MFLIDLLWMDYQMKLLLRLKVAIPYEYLLILYLVSILNKEDYLKLK